MGEPFQKFSRTEIASALQGCRRQYLVGKLSLPQTLEAIEDENILVGITKYDHDAYEPPHRHTAVSEYHLMISGTTEFFDLETNETHRFETGDFFLIPPGTIYSQKSLAGTEIIFVKTPAANDKDSQEETAQEKEWRRTPLS